MKPPLIEVEDVSFAYQGTTVLDHVSFTIAQGDYVGIIGPNGGGKTTLLKLLIGLLRAPSGRIRIAGMPIEQFKKRYEIGYVPQRIAQDAHSFPATVYEIIESGLVAKAGLVARMGAADRDAIQKAMAVAGIADLRDRLMNSLSGGQRQRVFVARALACDPKVLVLDEPFMGVDPSTQKDFYSFLKNLNSRNGLTILLVSHDIDVIAEEAKSILCLNRGLMCFGKASIIHEPKMIERLYRRPVTHLHRKGIT